MIINGRLCDCIQMHANYGGQILEYSYISFLRLDEIIDLSYYEKRGWFRLLPIVCP